MVIYCTNPTCRAGVAQPVGRCPTCQTPLPHRLLLAVGDGVAKTLESALPSGTRVADRYIVWKHPVWLDTRPEHPIASVETIPPEVMPYLRLSGLIQHIPRPYDYLHKAASGLDVDVLLLDAAPLALTVPTVATEPMQVQVLPTISQAWAGGTPLRQINWLRQMAVLWPALAEEGVASTLLAPETLRVDHALLRVTRLVSDPQGQPPTLSCLGQRWQAWVPQAQPPLREYLGWLTTALGQGQFPTAAALIAELDQALQTLATGLTVTVEWDADTDQGPARDRNEDACFPQRQAQKQVFLGTGDVGKSMPPLLLVCDGIGGHEQGSVASQTAIQTLTHRLQSFTQQGDFSPNAVAHWLTQALVQVNTDIATRNNDEQRSARARMGTTAVLALVHFPYVSVAHLGDSRAYRISARTAYQITLDDDVASREARLGYALYQEATHMAGGGALVQALGINDSAYLYPTVQHFLLDDPCVLLLCSDGLSDYDRVEALWPYTVAPLVGQSLPLAPTIQTLIHWANQLNGHDNVTVGLMRFLPQGGQVPALPAHALAPALVTASSPGHEPSTPSPGWATASPEPMAPPATQQVLVPSRPGRWPWWAFWAGALPTLLGLAVAGWAYLRWRPQAMALQALPPWPQGLQADALAPLPPATANIAVGSFWQRSAAWDPSQPDPLGLGSTPAAAAEPLPTVPVGSILKVVDQRQIASQGQWVYLQLCATPPNAAPAPPALSAAPPGNLPPGSQPAPRLPGALANPLAQPGRQGWVSAQSLMTNAQPLNPTLPSQRGLCSLP
ncbi:hypothetical protein GFS31_13250 [Leptolyngbya sp. BL0902]|uniref:protein phosphatase 2C domain-containing protein n=1 Tax=Leptolyngbya sp. BL0902 TaxID=1115757 RepID=UPI0018E8D80C|nr:protein phosphatase 2C domain-containing protein [Leptolyngbya sp. BL0902]QQE64644.1 hypothetical protein GFS31_13250 [Leptolyngbya sp. BL0902]